MPDPTMEGLREAIASETACGRDESERALAALADYLREHGVLLGAEGLLRAERRDYNPDLYDLVPIPQDGE